MSERSKETVLKTVVEQSTASSNLALSANEGFGLTLGALLFCRKAGGRNDCEYSAVITYKTVDNRKYIR